MCTKDARLGIIIRSRVVKVNHSTATVYTVSLKVRGPRRHSNCGSSITEQQELLGSVHNTCMTQGGDVWST